MGRAFGKSQRWYYAWGRDPSAPGCHGFLGHAPGATEISDWDGLDEPFKIQAISGNQYWSFQINQVQKFLISTASICWPVTAAYWFAETYEEGSPLGGSAADHFHVSVARWLLDGESTWRAPSWGSGTNCNNPGGPFDECVKAGSDDLDFWSHYP
jgi:hypothetical protein